MWTWTDVLLLVSPIVTAITTAVAAWLTISLKIQRVYDRVGEHGRWIASIESSVNYAHRRINDLLGRNSRSSDPRG